MIKIIWSDHYNCWVGINTHDILNQKKGISKANAIARVEHASDRTGFKVIDKWDEKYR